MHRRSFVITGAMATAARALQLNPGQGETPRVRLSTLRPRFANHGWGSLFFDESVDGKRMQVVDRTFTHGVSTHARSDLVYLVGGRYARLQAWVGVDTAPGRFKDGTAVFQVFADGQKLYDSGVMRPDTPARRVDVHLGRANVLRLVVSYVGTYADHVNWADADLVLHPQAALVDAPVVTRGPSRRILSGALAFSTAGDSLTGLLLPNGRRISLRGVVGLGANTHERPGANSTVRFHAARGGLRWEWQHRSHAEAPWTAPVDTVVQWPNPADAKVWLPWGHGWQWQDPLEPRPFEDRTYEYGAFFNREHGLSLPMATILDARNGVGVTFIQSPDDVILDMQVSTTRAGEIRFSRAFNRFGGGAGAVSFNVDIVVHEPDVRAALRAIVDRYPQYFDAPNALAHDVGGEGAYSGWEGDIDAPKLAAMGFTMNWKASLDFPYMGLFLPPVDDDVKWNRFAGGGSGVYTSKDEGRYGETSIRRMNEYSKAMRAQGFHVLNYFNVTEFGGNIVYPPPPTASSEADRWKDANDFLHGALEGAVLKTPLPTWTWGKAVIVDCGDPAYRAFLIDQARQHVARLPDSSGICIDRMDWLTRYNPNADDGVTWIDGINRHLRRSWMSLMEDLGAVFHGANKVIFANDMDRRLELMRHVDGFYDEHAHFPFNLNTSSFLALRKPLVCWTPEENPLMPDPDSYFQRHLYLGAFPTVPYTGNDHTVLPSEENERHYLDYGPLVRALKGRTWVLEPGVVEVRGNAAKANVFETALTYVVFVGLAPKAERVHLTLRGVGRQARVLHPGEPVVTTAFASGDRERSEWEIPLRRGCALLVIDKA